MSRKIPLTQGKFAIVDDEDYDWLNQQKWYARRNKYTYYAVCNSSRRLGKQKTIWMHRLILGLGFRDKQEIDHWNHDGLDCRRQNLRVCTSGENNQNRVPTKNASSKYKGVAWHKRDKKWQAHIQKGRKLLYLGYFDDEIKAAKAYDQKAKELFGEFACANF